MAESKRLTGRIAAEHIKLMAVPRPPQGAVARLIALGDATGIISDTMDELGIAAGVIAASVLKPTIAGRTIAGPALTVRNILQRIDPIEGARQHVNRMAEFEAHNLAQQGDVLVVQGVANVSNMGGISAQTGKRQGEIGAIVEGGVRDIAHSRAIGYPIWARDLTPVTGKWRIARADWPRLLVISIVGVFGYSTASVYGFATVPAGIGGLIYATQPLFIVLLAVPLVIVAVMFVWAARRDGEEDRAVQRRLGIRRKTRLGR